MGMKCCKYFSYHNIAAPSINDMFNRGFLTKRNVVKYREIVRSPQVNFICPGKLLFA